MPNVVLVLGENSAKSMTRAISFYMIGVRVGWDGENRGSHNSSFEGAKCVLLFISPGPTGVACECIQWFCNVSKSVNKAAIKVGEIQKQLEFSFGSRGWPLRNTLNLGWIHTNFPLGDNESKIFNLCAFKFALFRFKVKVVLA